MKKLIALLLACLMLTGSAFALGYTSRTGNAATFETYEETLLSAGEAVAAIYPGQEKTYVPNPVLADYPQGTTYVYRSADIYGGGRAANKQNTTVVVFAAEKFADKAAALDYLKGLGLTDIIDGITGSVLLITPANDTFGAADLDAFKALQTAFLANKASARTEAGAVYYPENEYFGCYGFQYVIGFGDGASFVHDYIATDLSLSGTIAGLLLVDGDMKADASVATAIPAYLVNASDATIEKYKAINEVNASSFNNVSTTWFRQTKPALSVLVADGGLDAAAYVKDAFDSLFYRVMRISATGGSLPYSLCERRAVINEVTQDNVSVVFHFEDRFNSVQTVTGEYLQAWYECVPMEAIDNTAPAGSIPLILALHGMGDDPLMFLDGQGFLELAGTERVAVVAPEHQDVFWCNVDGAFVDGIEAVVMPMLIQYMLDTYPALDASRVYVTGYSMGGWATSKTLFGTPGILAAVVPMSGMAHTPTEEQIAQFDTLDLPIMITTSTLDMGVVYDANAGGIGANHQGILQSFLGYNDMDALPGFDFEAYPISGFAADSGATITLNEEYLNHRWFLHNDDGIPMVGLSVTEDLTHSLYPEFADLMWSYASNFKRDLETGAVIYLGK